MAKLVFDIETSALPLEQFDEAQQEYLFRECEKIADESARAIALPNGGCWMTESKKEEPVVSAAGPTSATVAA